MENGQLIQDVQEWLAGIRDFKSTQILFRKVDDYIALRYFYDVSRMVISRTYSKGTKNLGPYGYYTKSVFDTKFVDNAKRGRLIDYKPWHIAGRSYDYEYGFDVRSRLIETKQYDEISREFRKEKENKEYYLQYDTIIEYCHDDEIAFSWNMAASRQSPSLELVTVTINNASEQITITIHCNIIYKILCRSIDISIFKKIESKIDAYYLGKSKKHGVQLAGMHDDISQFHEVLYVDRD